LQLKMRLRGKNGIEQQGVSSINSLAESGMEGTVYLRQGRERGGAGRWVTPDCAGLSPVMTDLRMPKEKKSRYLQTRGYANGKPPL